MVEATRGTFTGARGELQAIRDQVEKDPVAASVMTQVLETSNGDRLLASQAAAASVGGTDFTANDGVKILTAILKKLAGLLPEPAKSIATDLVEVFGIVADKLTKGENPIKKLQEDIDKIEKKVANLIWDVTGNSAYSDDEGGTVADPPSDRVSNAKLPGSVLWELEALENKLCVVKGLLDGEPRYPVNVDGQIIKPGTPPGEFALGGIETLKFKIDTLADLLGRTLVDATCIWDPEKPDDRTTRTRDEEVHVNKTPDKAVKEELHEIEHCLQEIKQCAEEIKTCLFQLKVPDEEEPPRIEVGPEVKRIFVYEEDVFAPVQAGASRLVRVRNQAFDLTDLGDDDEVEIAVFVLLPSNDPGAGPVRRLYARKTFRGPDSARLVNLSDVTGTTWLVGNAVDVRIRQSASGNNFQPPLEIAYQMVVEAQGRR